MHKATDMQNCVSTPKSLRSAFAPFTSSIFLCPDYGSQPLSHPPPPVEISTWIFLAHGPNHEENVSPPQVIVKALRSWLTDWLGARALTVIVISFFLSSQEERITVTALYSFFILRRISIGRTVVFLALWSKCSLSPLLAPACQKRRTSESQASAGLLLNSR